MHGSLKAANGYTPFTRNLAFISTEEVKDASKPNMGRDWVSAFTSFLTSATDSPVVLMGIGNPVKRDDSVGLYIAQKLRKEIGSAPSQNLRIRPPAEHPELSVSKVDLSRSRLLIFDAVEAGLAPASIIFARMDDTRFGFFATHNIPLRMHPSVLKNPERVNVLGVQPLDMTVGEGLSERVRPAADEVVRVAAGCVRGV